MSVWPSKIHNSYLCSTWHSKFCNDVGIWILCELVLCGKRCKVSQHHCNTSYSVQEQNHGDRHKESKCALSESKVELGIDATRRIDVKRGNMSKIAKLSDKMCKYVAKEFGESSK